LPAAARRVLVLGGYGAFGARAAERLARVPGIELIIAGRSLERARAAADALAQSARAVVSSAQIDAMAVGTDDIAALGVLVVINASGPFQTQDYALARACIAAGVHYIDLADARAFVTGIGVLDADARRAGVLVVSGASTVPALSTAVVDAYAPQFANLASVTIVISPGNSFDPGLATTRSVLGGLGRPFGAPTGETRASDYGWQGLRRQVIPGLGGRWLGLCEVPDLDLLPQRYPTLDGVRVYAALEVGAFHLGLWGLSWLVRAGIVPHPERLAAPLLAARHKLGFLGSDTGGMGVTMEGVDEQGRPKRIDWHMLAKRGHGPYIPATASVILAKRLLNGTLIVRGAMPCMGLFTVADFLGEIGDLAITAGTA
jgi:Saccharopine dehydrogenase NADP binding domain